MKIKNIFNNKIKNKKGLKGILQDVIGIAIVVVLILVVIMAYALKVRDAGDTSYTDLNDTTNIIEDTNTGGLSEPIN